MDRRRFFTSSAIGAALWAGIVTPHGHVLGQAFPVLQDKLDVAILLVVAASLVPATFEWWRHRRAVCRVRPATQPAERGFRHRRQGEPSPCRQRHTRVTHPLKAG